MLTVHSPVVGLGWWIGLSECRGHSQLDWLLMVVKVLTALLRVSVNGDNYDAADTGTTNAVDR